MVGWCDARRCWYRVRYKQSSQDGCACVCVRACACVCVCVHACVCVCVCMPAQVRMLTCWHSGWFGTPSCGGATLQASACPCQCSYSYPCMGSTTSGPPRCYPNPSMRSSHSLPETARGPRVYRAGARHLPRLLLPRPPLRLRCPRRPRRQCPSRPLRHRSHIMTRALHQLAQGTLCQHVGATSLPQPGCSLHCFGTSSSPWWFLPGRLPGPHFAQLHPGAAPAACLGQRTSTLTRE